MIECLGGSLIEKRNRQGEKDNDHPRGQSRLNGQVIEVQHEG